MSCKNCGEKCKDVCSFDDNVGCKGEKSNFKDKQGIDGGYINCKAIKKFDCDLCLENYDKKGEAFSYYEKKTTRDPDWIGAGQCKGTYTTVFLSGSRMNRGVISMDCKIDTCKEGYSKNGNKCEVKGHITDESVEEVNVNGYTGFFGSAVDNTGNRVSVESGSAQTCSKNYHWIGGKCEFNYRIVNN